ncbi:hypothetical protein GA0115244_117231 [Streptomyces sp. DvalAA-19]|nr:hypothetical protein GA0115244_117231 [Streptomyces sp. DvalAA-19]
MVNNRLGPEVCFMSADRPIPFLTSSQELAMADLAFVATTIAVFALVVLVARGVTKL